MSTLAARLGLGAARGGPRDGQHGPEVFGDRQVAPEVGAAHARNSLDWRKLAAAQTRSHACRWVVSSIAHNKQAGRRTFRLLTRGVQAAAAEHAAQRWPPLRPPLRPSLSRLYGSICMALACTAPFLRNHSQLSNCATIVQTHYARHGTLRTAGGRSALGGWEPARHDARIRPAAAKWSA